MTAHGTYALDLYAVLTGLAEKLKALLVLVIAVVRVVLVLSDNGIAVLNDNSHILLVLTYRYVDLPLSHLEVKSTVGTSNGHNVVSDAVNFLLGHLGFFYVTVRIKIANVGDQSTILATVNVNVTATVLVKLKLFAYGVMVVITVDHLKVFYDDLAVDAEGVIVCCLNVTTIFYCNSAGGNVYSTLGAFHLYAHPLVAVLVNAVILVELIHITLGEGVLCLVHSEG